MKGENMIGENERQEHNFDSESLLDEETTLLSGFKGEAKKMAKILLLISGVVLGADTRNIQTVEHNEKVGNTDPIELLDIDSGQSNTEEASQLRLSANDFETNHLVNLFAEKSAKNPTWILANVNLYKDSQILGFDLVKIIKSVSEEYPWAFLDNIKDLKSIPGLDLVKLIEQAEAKEPWAFIRFVQNFKDIPGLDLVKLVEHAGEKLCMDFLDNIENIKNIKGVNLSKLVENAEKEKPGFFLRSIQNLKDIPGLDLAKLITHAAEKEPDDFFQNIQSFRDIPGLDLAKIFRRLFDKNKDFFLHDNYSFKYLAGIPGLGLEKFVEQQTEYDHYFFFRNLENFKNIPDLNLTKIVEKIINDETYYFLNNINEFRDLPVLDLGKMIEKTALLDGRTFIKNIEKFKNIPDLDLMKLLEKVSQRYPEYFLENISDIKNVPNLNLTKLIEQAGEKSSRSIIWNIEELKKIPNLNLVVLIEKGVNEAPISFFESIQHFKNISGLDLAKLVKQVALIEPGSFLRSIKYLKDVKNLDLSSLVKQTWEKDGAAFLYAFGDIEDIPGLDFVSMVDKAGTENPFNFIVNIGAFKDIPGLDLVKLVGKAEMDEPGSFLDSIQLKDIPGLDLVTMIGRASIKQPRVFLQNTEQMKNVKGLDLASLVDEAGTREPYHIFSNIEKIKDISNLDLVKLIKKIEGKTPAGFLGAIKNLKDIPGLDLAPMIERAAYKEPILFFYQAKEFSNIPNFNLQKVAEKIFSINPTCLTNYDAKAILSNIKNPELKSTKILQKITTIQTTLLLQDMVSHNLTEQEAVSIVSDDKKLFQALCRIQSEPDHLGKESVEREIKNLTLRIVRNINYLHEESDDVRFEVVKDLSPVQLYNTMVNGEEEVFTSSFNGLFNRLLKEMKQTNIGGVELLKQVGPNKVRIFIKECAGFNRLNEFLATLPSANAQELLAGIVKDLDSTGDKLAQATTVADIFGMVKDEKTLKILQEQIKIEYERVGNKPNVKDDDKILYGILSGMFGDKAVIDKEWFKDKKEKFGLEDTTKIDSKDLFNRGGVNIQQYYFYDDADGQGSFESFLGQYQNKGEWKIEKKDKYVLIKSAKKDKKIEIYANFPIEEDEGVKAINKVLSTRRIDTIVVVHRGHSYHAQKTIERITPLAKIVSLGSCGGYNNVEGVLAKSPNAHIISTKGTGTMLVNDPLLKMLNEQILSGRDIDWPEFWERAEKKLGSNSNFSDYVSPHKNLGVMFLKAYNRALQDKK